METLSELIPLTCPACNQRFKAKQRYIRDGGVAACTNCKHPMIFSDTSSDEQIQKALKAARRFRKAQQPQVH